jgi:hypothetical protein
MNERDQEQLRQIKELQEKFKSEMQIERKRELKNSVSAVY